MSDDFATYIQSERDRLKERRNALLVNIGELQNDLAGIEKEFAAIAAYEAAKAGKTLRPAGAGKPRARRDSKRYVILEAVSASPIGLSRGDILTALGVRGDKSGEISVSNALTAMTKAGQLVRQDGRYHAPAQPLAAAAE